MTRLVTQIEDVTRKIYDVSEALAIDEERVFMDASGRLAFVRHEWGGETCTILSSEVIVIGGDEGPEFPIVEVDRFAVTLHQGADALPPLPSADIIDAQAPECIWRDLGGRNVLIGRSTDMQLRVVAVGGAEPLFPCVCRDAGTTLNLGN